MKANELKTWLLYIGPVLFHLTVNEGLIERFLLLSYSIRLLPTSRTYADQAGKLIHLFLNKVEECYGNEVFSANIHALSHLSWQVKNFGPLWTTSAMMFESANYLLQSKFTGTVNHLALLVERYRRNKASYASKVDTDSLTGLCLELKLRAKSFTWKAVKSSIPERFRGEGDEFYSNAQIRGLEFDSVAHFSSVNSYVSFSTHNSTKYGRIRIFMVKNGLEKIGIQLYRVVNAVKCNHPVKAPFFSFLKVEESSRYDTIFADPIKEKLLRIDALNEIYFVPLIEAFEHD